MTSNDFIVAQQRVAARRQAREVAAQTHLNRRRNTAISQRVSSLPFPLSRIGTAGLTTWDMISGREGTRPSFRVGQVDAELLDEELLDLLKGQVGEGLKYFGTHIQDDWSAEIMLALRAILFKLSIWDHDATYGATLQNLKFTDARHSGSVLVSPSKWQKGLYGLFTVGGKYAWTRWENYLVDSDNGYSTPSPLISRLSRITDLFTNVHSTAAFASFLVFLVNGRYRTLLDRILRLRLAPPTSQVSREVSFEYLNRQLVWHAFTEFLLFVLPLVGISRWRRFLSRFWRRTKSLFNTSSSDELSSSTKKGELAFLPERTCAICYHDQNALQATEEGVMAAAASTGVIGSAQTDITNPYETVECGCIYCFVCIASKLEAEEGEGWTCLRCGEEVRRCRAWSGDVVVETRAIEDKEEKPRARKSVEFQDDRMRMNPTSGPEDTITDHDTKKTEDGDSSDHDSQLGQEEAYDEDEDQGLEEYEDEYEAE
ncbi:7a6c81f8-e936-454f-b5ce-9e0da55e43b4 [Sclerotinia trifoliorum]|uniref:7a6c81f8-e936-454f-b5ce-9e0da55e43b4 n=1 Tax=Sclerotinia trifoliorum TaxID=28548 RepID=A0A8H2VPP9_9HELO|nr:7a6c81f8-e936-454f-b5ce-9e0da55e43b4 [Sclerotinia trifoliorum]